MYEDVIWWVGSFLAIVLTVLKIFEWFQTKYRGLHIEIDNLKATNVNGSKKFEIKLIVTNTGHNTTIKKMLLIYYINKFGMEKTLKDVGIISMKCGESKSLKFPYLIGKELSERIFNLKWGDMNLGHFAIVIDYDLKKKIKTDFYIDKKSSCLVFNEDIIDRLVSFFISIYESMFVRFP